MLAICAEAIAGSTVEETIGDALDLSNRTGCMVRIEINDITMSVVDSPVFGKTREDRVAVYMNQFHQRLANDVKLKGGI